MLTITPISSHESDAQQLIAELSAELSALYNNDGTGLFQSADVEGPRAIFLLALSNDEPVGCGALRPINQTTAEIKRLYVRPETRRQGVSRRLLEALEESALSFNYERVILETGYLQIAAVSLYLASGYKFIPNYGPYVGNPDSICFEKILSVS